jgi:hypothetical protein
MVKPKTVQTDLYAFGIIVYEWLSKQILQKPIMIGHSYIANN